MLDHKLPTSLEDLIDEAWKQYDLAEKAGDSNKAYELKNLAFALLEKLPENKITLRIKQ